MSLNSTYLGIKIQQWNVQSDPAIYATLLSTLIDRIGTFDKAAQELIVSKTFYTTEGAYPAVKLLNCGLDQDVEDKYFPDIMNRLGEKLEPVEFIEKLSHCNIHEGYPEKETALQLVNWFEEDLLHVDAVTGFHAVMTVLSRCDNTDFLKSRGADFFGNAVRRLFIEDPEVALSSITAVFLDCKHHFPDYYKALLRDMAQEIVIPAVKDDPVAASHLHIILEKSGIVVDGFNEKFAEQAKSLRQQWRYSMAEARSMMTQPGGDLEEAALLLDGRRQILTNNGLNASFATAVNNAEEKINGALEQFVKRADRRRYGPSYGAC